MNKIKFLILLIFVGFVIVALPDSDVRLFSISKQHGPSVQDAIGLLLILLPYSWLIIETWKKRDKMRIYQNAKAFKAGLFLCGLAVGLVIASVANDYEHWWIYGVIVLAGLQIAVLYIVFK